MGESTIIWLTVATSLIVVGCLMFVFVMAALDWDFTKLSTSSLETNNYEVTENFLNVKIYTDVDNILFLPSDDGKCKVVCEEFENRKHSVEVENETLVIKSLDERRWYEYIGVSIGNSKITVYLTETEYSLLLIKEKTGFVELPKDFKFENIDITTSTGGVKTSASAETMKIKTSTGFVYVSDVEVGTLEINVSTGMVKVDSVSCKNDVEINVSTGATEIKDVDCNNFFSNGNTGDLSMKNVIANETFSLERTTGEIEFEGCDANEILITTDTGDVEGSLLSEKIFFAKTDTGRVSVPKSLKGGKCEITTDTGDIDIEIQ